MAGPYGNPETTKGGQAPYFTAAMNIRVSRTGKNEEWVGDERGTAYNLKLGIKKCRYAKSFTDYELMSIMGHGFSKMSDMWNYAQATNQLTSTGAGWYQLNVIGRDDLGIKKNCRGEDVKDYFRENNLYEIFVKQLFSGSAWGNAQLQPWQLEMIGNVDIHATPVEIIDPKVEVELAEVASQIAAQADTNIGGKTYDMPIPGAPKMGNSL
jgi:hypothetical protein